MLKRLLSAVTHFPVAARQIKPCKIQLILRARPRKKTRVRGAQERMRERPLTARKCCDTSKVDNEGSVALLDATPFYSHGTLPFPRACRCEPGPFITRGARQLAQVTVITMTPIFAQRSEVYGERIPVRSTVTGSACTIVGCTNMATVTQSKTATNHRSSRTHSFHGRTNYVTPLLTQCYTVSA